MTGIWNPPKNRGCKFQDLDPDWIPKYLSSDQKENFLTQLSESKAGKKNYHNGAVKTTWKSKPIIGRAICYLAYL